MSSGVQVPILDNIVFLCPICKEGIKLHVLCVSEPQLGDADTAWFECLEHGRQDPVVTTIAEYIRRQIGTKHQ